MKKLFFTAIALLAFSGISMASTVEVKESAVTDCYSRAGDYIDNVYDPCGTHTAEENNAVYQAFLAGCLKPGKVVSAN